MAKIKINRQQLNLLLNDPQLLAFVQREKAQPILDAMRRLAPRDTGDLANSFSMQAAIRRGKPSIQIVSSDPQIRAILEGTKPPYQAMPPFGAGSALGGWGQRHGFTTFPSRRALARRIMVVGTLPAGSRTGNADWLKNAIREGTR